MMNFRDALNVKIEDVPAAPLPPAGVYRFRISKQPVLIEDMSDGKYSQLAFPCQAVEAVTVDADDLAAYGDVRAISQRVTFMTTNDPDDEQKVRNAQTMERLARFLQKHLGMDASLSMKEAIDSSLGQEFLGEIGHRADRNDPEKIYAEIKSTAPIE